MRLNPEGIKRNLLIHYLRDPRAVADARRIDACLLCRGSRVNEAGICEICYGMLDGEELKQAVRWRSGQGP